MLAVAVFGIWYALHGDSFRRANPGDCLNVAVGLGIIRDAQIVDCTPAQAKSKVLGAVKDKHWNDFKDGGWQTLCKPWNAKGAIFHHEPDSDQGDVLCLEPLNKK
ncbi:MAG TPA: hypothetical protein DGT23_23960 [Micromonosporaceae bacterium]|nr:hypothetical protein [Micromonosporaceae bacterium]